MYKCINSLLLEKTDLGGDIQLYDVLNILADAKIDIMKKL
jgi:hypothetical protein